MVTPESIQAMTKIVSLLAFFAAMLIAGIDGTAQDSGNYYRYFEVKTQNTSLRSEMPEDFFTGTAFQLEESCTSKIVVKIPADYPKRVPAIVEELTEAMKSRSSAVEIESIEIIKATEVENFCP